MLRQLTNLRRVATLKKGYVCGVEIGGQSAAVAITNQLGTFDFKKKGIPTRDPVTPLEAIDNICNTINQSKIPINSIGIASFGPLQLDKGSIGLTPKPLWSDFPLVSEFRKRFPNIPIILETDVNAPAYSEFLEYQIINPQAKSVGYVTIGTGVGVGVFVDGKPLHGRMHPEVGHLYPRPHPNDVYCGESPFKGACPFHGSCFEGMLSSISIARRLDIKPNDIRTLKKDSPIWEVWTDYLGQLTAACTLTYSLDAFVIGGGIITAPGREFLLDMVRVATGKYINGYYKLPDVITPFHGQDAGLVGACALALDHEVFAKREITTR